MERIICLLICLIFKSFAQDEFIFWAELSNKDLILFHQSQNLSPAMTQSQDFQSEFVCELFYTEKDYEILERNSLGLIDDELMTKSQKLSFLNSHKDLLTECFIGANIKVKDIVQSEFAQARNETYIKILPLRFNVEFGEKSALIYYLKK